MRLPADLIARAVENVREGITISDCSLPDNPLVYVNRGFLEMTGYSAEDVRLRNCRYLQGPGTDRQTVSKIAEAIKAGQSISVELLNYKKSGEPFWNSLSITPLYNDAGNVTHFVGIQDDVTALRESQAAQRQAEQSALTNRALHEGEERERHRLGMELHDNISQLLSSANLYLDVAKDPEHAPVAIPESKAILGEAIREIRALSHRMIQPSFQQEGFRDAVEKLVERERSSRSPGIRLNFDQPADVAIDETVQLHLYRILQEQLNNISKYAAASDVLIHISISPMEIALSVTDDGRGFEVGAASTGIGLKNMRGRVDEIRGSMNIISSPRKGTSLTVVVPIRASHLA